MRLWKPVALMVLAVVVAVVSSRPSGEPVGRVVLVHGMGTTAEAFRGEDPFRSFVGALELRGWDVETIPYRTEGPDMAATLRSLFDADPSGRAVLDMWLEDYDRFMADLPAIDGPTILVGISWGGLLALQAAGRGAVVPDALVVHLPACDPNRLAEFAGFPLDALADIPQVSVPTRISWATDDVRVGWECARRAARRFGSTTREYHHLGHVTNPSVLGDVLTWVEGLRPR